jgi:hypothetical protein
MATSLQYEFFRRLYEEQNERRKILEVRAQFYFSILSLYFGIVVFKFSDLLTPSKALSPASLSPTFRTIHVIVAGCLVIGLTTTLLAIRIRNFEMPNNPRKIIDNMSEWPPSDDDFCDHRIVDYAVATTRNWDRNEECARYLRISGWFLVAAVVIHFISIVVS